MKLLLLLLLLLLVLNYYYTTIQIHAQYMYRPIIIVNDNKCSSSSSNSPVILANIEIQCKHEISLGSSTDLFASCWRNVTSRTELVRQANKFGAARHFSPSTAASRTF